MEAAKPKESMQLLNSSIGIVKVMESNTAETLLNSSEGTHHFSPREFTYSSLKY